MQSVNMLLVFLSTGTAGASPTARCEAHSGEVMARIASLLIATVLNDQQVGI